MSTQAGSGRAQDFLHRLSDDSKRQARAVHQGSGGPGRAAEHSVANRNRAERTGICWSGHGLHQRIGFAVETEVHIGAGPRCARTRYGLRQEPPLGRSNGMSLFAAQ